MEVQTLHQDPRVISNDEILPRTRNTFANHRLKLIILIEHRFSSIFYLFIYFFLPTKDVIFHLQSIVCKHVCLIFSFEFSRTKEYNALNNTKASLRK